MTKAIYTTIIKSNAKKMFGNGISYMFYFKSLQKNVNEWKTKANMKRTRERKELLKTASGAGASLL